MTLVEKRNPWHYKKMIHDSSLAPLYTKQYQSIKTKDFYNIDHSVIPMFVNPAKLYLYRYMRLEPYLHELFNLDEVQHPEHPLHPSTTEVLEIINRNFYSTRGHLKFPLEKKQRRVKKKVDLKKEKMLVFLCAGESETDSELSPDEVTDWTSEDMESGSEQSIKSWKYSPEENKDVERKEKTKRKGTY